MKSPSYHGYDVSDYYTVNPEYGTMEDFEDLLNQAHLHGIKIIIDFVINHSSDQNPWFDKSAKNEPGFRDYYVWSEIDPGTPGPWGGDPWNYRGGAFYYAAFGAGMPDLNYKSEALRNEIFNVTKFWLAKGVDGFRMDAVPLLIEDGTRLSNAPQTLDFLHEFNTTYKTANPETFTVGEVWDNTRVIVPYVQENRLDACFEFDLANCILAGVEYGYSTVIQNQLDFITESYPLLQYGVFLTNHDQDRVFERFSNDPLKMKQAAAIYLTMPGIPFIYYGEEIGMTGSGDDRNKRRPMQWTSEQYSGFSTHSPWYGLGPGYVTNNVKAMSGDDASVLEYYKKLIRIRNSQPSLRRGYLTDIPDPEVNLLSFARIYNDEAAIVISNLNTYSCDFTLSLPPTSLPQGKYFVKELLNGTMMGTVNAGSDGGFVEWQPESHNIKGRETFIILLTPRDPVGVTEQKPEEFRIIVYPNPADGPAEISVYRSFPADYLLEIYSSEGKKVYNDHFRGDKTMINTEGWKPGLYLVKISSCGTLRVQKLMVRRR
jgi:alpha-amylase